MHFTKMHGLGNDYIYVDGHRERLEGFDLPHLARLLSDRNFGIGGDGLILIMPSEQADFRMRMLNADGSESEMCGNGIRCLAKYVYDHGLTTKTEFTVETGAGLIRPTLTIENGQVASVTVDMGCPRLMRKEIPMLGSPAKEPVINEPLTVRGVEHHVTCVSMGNPHCVLFTDDVEAAPVTTLGPLIEQHEAFPARTNVEFVKIIGPELIQMRVWERGSGETLACGTGASAAVVAANLNKLANRSCTVKLLGGNLHIDWRENDHIFLTGPAVEVFSGEVDPEALQLRKT
ncbi:MAG: diaminopimelate epimerase [Candidatus Zipacnadales bacterium]